MENKLTGEKLQAKLEEWFEIIGEYNEEEDRQAVNQIRECIHVAFTGTDEEDVIKETIEQQKATVLREEVSNVLLDTIHQYLRHETWHDAVEFGLKKLKELGMEVSDGE